MKNTTVSTHASKTACRSAWAAHDNTVVANVGNRTTDLDGVAPGPHYLLPDYGLLN